MPSPSSWTDNSDEGEINFHFFHPNPAPLDANLWFYEDHWTLDVSWMVGDYAAGKETFSDRRTFEGDEDSAKEWASDLVDKILQAALAAA